MSDLRVRIEKLEPMRVASVRAVSETPEHDAWEKLSAWAEPQGFLDDLEHHPVFGFNNPNPTHGNTEYGYEFWMQVDATTAPDDTVEVKDFPGGRYAVTTCKLQGDPQGNVFEVWQQLLAWVQLHDYVWRHTHELERQHDPGAAESEMVLDLYLPIEDTVR